MKVIFMGTPEFAVPSLKMLIEKHRVLSVVCQPDKPNKRGKKIVFGAVKQVACQNGIDVLQPASARDPELYKRLAELKPDVIVVAAYGKILPNEILRLPKFGCINVHGSLLPKYRGAAPIQWAIINGDNITGITIMLMSEGLDKGDMLVKRPMNIEVDDTYGSLSERMSIIGAETLIDVLSQLLDGKAKTVMQNDAEATYAPLIKKELGHIKWNNSGKDIVNLIRGLNPAPGAYSEINGQKLKIWSAQTFRKNDKDSDYGLVLDVVNSKGIIVGAQNESVLLTEVQVDGSKKMSAAEFLRGHKITAGMLLK